MPEPEKWVVSKTGIILFMQGIRADGNGPHDFQAFKITRFSEREIAHWLGLRSRMTRRVTVYEDGTDATARWPAGPVWDVHDKAGDPALLCDAYALDFGRLEGDVGHGSRAGRVTNYSAHSNVGYLLLRLARSGSVRPANELIFFNDEARSRSRTVAPGMWDPSGEHFQDWEVWTLDSPTRVTLQRVTTSLFAPLLRAYHGTPDDCFVATEHFLRAGTSNRIDQELHLWISLEAMFGVGEKQGGLKEKMTGNAAAFVQDPRGQQAMLAFLRDRYDRRCDIVHGAYQPSAESLHRTFVDMYREYCELEDVVRRALRRYLRCRLEAGLSREGMHSELAKARSSNPPCMATFPIDPAFDESLDPPKS